MSKTVIICSGGTGGHIFPACVLFSAVRQRGYRITMITDVRGKVFCNNIRDKIVLETIRTSRINPIKLCYCFLSAFYRSFKLWFKKRPDIIIGFGGVFTIIPIITAKVFGSKVAIYEQNSVVGKANKFLQKLADLKLSSFDIGNNWRKVPPIVREEFLRNVQYSYDGVIKIMVIGGSQGAMSFSHIIPKALEILSSEERKEIEIIQQMTHGDVEGLSQTYKKLGVKSTVKNFIHNSADIMLSSQLVICRSGASTLSELSATGRPAILIPYPHASDNHQFYNAVYYKNKRNAWVLEEKDKISENLANILKQILQNRKLLETASVCMLDNSVSHATNDFIRLIELV